MVNSLGSRPASVQRQPQRHSSRQHRLVAEAHGPVFTRRYRKCHDCLLMANPCAHSACAAGTYEDPGSSAKALPEPMRARGLSALSHACPPCSYDRDWGGNEAEQKRPCSQLLNAGSQRLHMVARAPLFSRRRSAYGTLVDENPALEQGTPRHRVGSSTTNAGPMLICDVTSQSRSVDIHDLLTLAANLGNDSLPSEPLAYLPLYLHLRISHDISDGNC
jgi:hypothetical protein